jgi:hypothetical protein
MATEYSTTNYGFAQTRRNANQIRHTNGTTRTQLWRELVVVEDANGNAFIGFVAELDGIEAGADGQVDLFESDVISTEQREDAGVFVTGDSNVYVAKQDNSVPAEIKQASAVGLWPLKALIVETVNGADGRIRLRMPPQDGNIVAVV